MKRIALMVGLGAMAVPVGMAAPRATEVTFYKDVLPVLQQNCQSCHRAGEVAPMAFETYKQTRPFARAIKEAVLTKKMPPWFADPHVGKFKNDRTMAKNAVDTLVAWADSGAKEGDPKTAPAPKSFTKGWSISQPDLVVEMPSEYDVPEKGTIEYTYFVVPTGFTEDRWVTMAEARPGNTQLVHHIIAFVREPGSPWMKDAKPGVAYVPPPNTPNTDSGGGRGSEFLVGYAPGFIPERMEPGQAKLIKAGSDIVLQMHYTANGKSGKDRSRVGFVFAKEQPKERVMTLAAANGKFVIPPGAEAHKVESAITLQADSTLMNLTPHMHLRGKAFEYRVVLPSGETRELLRVPKYDFNWQLTYDLDQPLHLPAGSRIECTAWFDNSANNPANPDPTKEVRFGEQSWEEMMIGFFNVSFDAKMNPSDLFRKKKAPAKPSASE
jgi:hypothetical protein